MPVVDAKRIGMRLIGMRLAAFVVILGVGLFGPVSGHAADPIKVVLDEVRLVKVPERASMIVLGNPLIADVSVQPGGLMLITAKGHGATSIAVLDSSGAVVMESMIEVTAPQNIVTVHRGTDRYSYACTPNCNPRVMLGDTFNYFGQSLDQITSRAGAAAAMTPGSAPPSK